MRYILLTLIIDRMTSNLSLTPTFGVWIQRLHHVLLKPQSSLTGPDGTRRAEDYARSVTGTDYRTVSDDSDGAVGAVPVTVASVRFDRLMYVGLFCFASEQNW